MNDTNIENTIKTIVADKGDLLLRLLEQMKESGKAMRGFAQAAPTVLTNESEANTRKMLNTTMVHLQRQQELNQMLIAFLIMLLNSKDFTGWQAELAMKLGANPQEVLQKMFKAKMDGEF